MRVQQPRSWAAVLLPQKNMLSGKLKPTIEGPSFPKPTNQNLFSAHAWHLFPIKKVLPKNRINRSFLVFRLVPAARYIHPQRRRKRSRVAGKHL